MLPQVWWLIWTLICLRHLRVPVPPLKPLHWILSRFSPLVGGLEVEFDRTFETFVLQEFRA